MISRKAPSSVFYTFDERGDTVQRLDAAGGVLSNRMTDAFGTPGGSASTGDPYDGIGAQWGYYTDVDTGLILCMHRYYDPQTGRWVTRDPLGFRSGPNMYNYCDNEPVQRRDRMGLDWIDCMASCIEESDPIVKFQNYLGTNVPSWLAHLPLLTLTIPKALGRALGFRCPTIAGKMKRWTTPLSILELAGHKIPWWPQGLRNLGRVFSGVETAYGLYMAYIEMGCVDRCIIWPE